MSVENPNVIDIIRSEKDGGRVTLTITDHLEWGDGKHLLKLQDKLNKYLAFIESGEILEKYPGAQGKAVKINVACKFRPDSEGEKFLHLCRGKIAEAGFEFSYETHGI
jgi:hypothetical protein